MPLTLKHESGRHRAVLAFWSAAALALHAAAASDAECRNAVPGRDDDCFENVWWAKRVGYHQHPEWYMPYGITADSSFYDFQKALYEKGQQEIGSEAHNCPMPCDASLPDEDPPNITDILAGGDQTELKDKLSLVEKEEAALEVQDASRGDYAMEAERSIPHTTNDPPVTEPAPSVMPLVKSAENQTSSDGSFTSSGVTVLWLLIIVGVCCCLPAMVFCCSFFLCYDRIAWLLSEPEGAAEQKRKTRGVKRSGDDGDVEQQKIESRPLLETDRVTRLVAAPPILLSQPNFVVQHPSGYVVNPHWMYGGVPMPAVQGMVAAAPGWRR